MRWRARGPKQADGRVPEKWFTPWLEVLALLLALLAVAAFSSPYLVGPPSPDAPDSLGRDLRVAIAKGELMVLGQAFFIAALLILAVLRYVSPGKVYNDDLLMRTLIIVVPLVMVILLIVLVPAFRRWILG